MVCVLDFQQVRIDSTNKSDVYDDCHVVCVL